MYMTHEQKTTDTNSNGNTHTINYHIKNNSSSRSASRNDKATVNPRENTCKTVVFIYTEGFLVLTPLEHPAKKAGSAIGC